MVYREAFRAFRLEYWKALLIECEGNVSAMARVSGKNRTEIHKILVKLGLQRIGGPSGRRNYGNWGSLTD